MAPKISLLRIIFTTISRLPFENARQAGIYSCVSQVHFKITNTFSTISHALEEALSPGILRKWGRTGRGEMVEDVVFLFSSYTYSALPVRVRKKNTNHLFFDFYP